MRKMGVLETQKAVTEESEFIFRKRTSGKEKGGEGGAGELKGRVCCAWLKFSKQRCHLTLVLLHIDGN